MSSDFDAEYLEEHFNIPIHKLSELVDILEKAGCEVQRNKDNTFICSVLLFIQIEAMLLLLKTTGLQFSQAADYIMLDPKNAGRLANMAGTLKVIEDRMNGCPIYDFVASQSIKRE